MSDQKNNVQFQLDTQRNPSDDFKTIDPPGSAQDYVHRDDSQSHFLIKDEDNKPSNRVQPQKLELGPLETGLATKDQSSYVSTNGKRRKIKIKGVSLD